jgi:hypothetical protein
MSDQKPGDSEQPEPIGYVYFIREVMKNGKGRIKIGFSLYSPDQRFIDINLCCSRDIEKFALMRATHSHEQALHKRFKKLWKRGEWFRSHSSLLAYIAENAHDWREYQAEERTKGEAERFAKNEKDVAEFRRQYRIIEAYQSQCHMLGLDPNETPIPGLPKIKTVAEVLAETGFDPEAVPPSKPKRKRQVPTRRQRYAPLQALLDQLAADKDTPP